MKATQSHQAHAQWAKRPIDERAPNLVDLHHRATHLLAHSREKEIPWSTLSILPDGGEVIVRGPNGGNSYLTHSSFSQLSRAAGAPAEYLRTLPAPLTAQLVTHGLASRPKDDASKILFQLPDEHSGDALRIRGFRSESYAWVPHAHVTERLLDLGDKGWLPPPARVPWSGQGLDADQVAAIAAQCRPATAAEAAVSLNVKEGDPVAPAGLYLSDKDLFAFLVSDQTIEVEGNQLRRGIIVRNGELGDCALSMSLFLFDGVCGNHIIHGYSELTSARVRHVGDSVQWRFSDLSRKIMKTAQLSGTNEVSRIMQLRSTTLGATRDEALDVAVAQANKRKLLISRKRFEAAYDTAAKSERYGSPRTAWALSQGLTELSQHTPYADKRHEQDVLAGRWLDSF